MDPKPAEKSADHDLFRTELVNLIDHRRELVKLAEPTRLMAFLLYLKHVYALREEDTVARWSENPYWKHFSGERYFRHDLPCDPSSLVRWRQRIGEAGCEWLLAQSIAAATGSRIIKRNIFETVVPDTTVQPKAIAHPTDSRLLKKAREQLVDAAQHAGITLLQSYARVGQAAEHQAGGYAPTPGNTAACSARSAARRPVHGCW